MTSHPLPDRSPSQSVYPGIGLLALLVATPFAVMSIPVEYVPAGALFFPALVLASGLLVAPAFATFRSPAALFRVEYLILIGLAYWLLLDELQVSYDLKGVSRPAVQAAFVAIAAFAAGVWMAVLHSPWPLPKIVVQAARVELNADALFVVVLVCSLVALFRFAYPCGFDPFIMLAGLTGNRWSAPWGRGMLGGWDAFIDHLAYFGYLSPTLAVLLAHRLRSWLRPTVLTSLALAVLVTLFLAQGGGRRIIGVTWGAAIICWVLLKGRTVRLKTLLVPAVGGAVLLVIMQLMLEYRGIGYTQLFAGERTERSYESLHVDDNFLRLAQTIEIIPVQHPFVYEKVLVWALIRPIPRVLWQNKPIDPGFYLADAVGVRGASLSCSVVGEFYMSYGWTAVFLGGWLFGRLAGMCNQLLTTGGSPSRVLMYALGAMAIFAGLRSLIELILMSYMLLVWLGVVALYNWLHPPAE